MSDAHDVPEAGRLLARRFSRLMAHSVTESRGSHSRWHLPTDASEFFDALVTYADVVRVSAKRIRTPLPDAAGSQLRIVDRLSWSPVDPSVSSSFVVECDDAR